MIAKKLPLLSVLACLTLSACADLNYMRKTALNHFHIMGQREPIDAWLTNPEVSDSTKSQLRFAVKIRAFASEVLLLPDNDSYTSYVDLERPYVSWAVFMAPPLSLEATTWCFPVAGCVPYRGYFSALEAEQFASLHPQMDTYVTGAPAYSTLGWFDDPLLNTMLSQGERITAEYLFHELAHQKIYVASDADFNEAFATAVAHLGLLRWAQATHDPALQEQVIKNHNEKLAFYERVSSLKERLEAIYSSDQSDAVKTSLKEKQLLAFTKELPDNHPFTKNLNNAKLNALSTYYAQVPDFLALFEQCKKQFEAFYEAVELLSKKSIDERRRYLAESSEC